MNVIFKISNFNYIIMSEQTLKKMQVPEIRINVAESSEVRYWCGKFNCSQRELEEAINKVGSSSIALERFFETSQNNR